VRWYWRKNICMGCVSFLFTYSSHQGCTMGHIEDIVVREEYRGKKIGFFIIKTLRELALKHKYAK
jgi:GNAT superfamily N-acetyltransferase